MKRSHSLVGWVLLASIGYPQGVMAQVTPDGTVGSIVSPGPVFNITGGTRPSNGPNLFHSFSQFSLPTGTSAIFQNDPAVQTIFSRVTGNSVSNIDGLIQANGSASLFLLNPNGILFGPNARLEIGGSFVASTADRFQFADGSEFAAVNATQNPLLTISVPVGLQLGTGSGDITQNGHLAVVPGQSLTLLGSTVLQQGSLTAPGGIVQVLGDRVALLDNAQIDVSSPTQGGTIQIGGDYQGRGTIPLATATYIAPTASIHADAHLTGNGGQIIAWGTDSLRAYGTFTARGGIQAGNGGLIETSSRGGLDVTGVTADASAAQGTAGTWLIDPRNITISRTAPTGNGAFNGVGLFTPSGNNAVIAESAIRSRLNAGTSVFITTGTTGSQAGNITATGFGFPVTTAIPVTFTLQAANNIDIDFQNSAFGGGALSVVMEAGNDIALRNSTITAANFTLQANNNINLNELSVRSFNNRRLNVNLEADRDRSGLGNLTMEGGTMTLAGGGFNARAVDMTFLGGVNIGSHNPMSSTVEGNPFRLEATSSVRLEFAQIATTTNGAATGGAIFIESPTVLLQPTVINRLSRINTQTNGSGAGGAITVRASNRFLIDGTPDSARVRAATLGTGRGGDITIETPTLEVLNGGFLNAIALNQGDAGDLTIRANRVEIGGTSQTGEKSQVISLPTTLQTPTASGNGGELSIETQTLRVFNRGAIAVADRIRTRLV